MQRSNEQDPLPPTDTTRGSSGSEHKITADIDLIILLNEEPTGWYQRHAREGYGGFQQFQNGYDSHVP